MQYAINLQPVLPVRKESSETSEMVTQLLFGETMQMLEETDRWYYIQNTADGYKGWVDKKMIAPISEKEYALLVSSQKHYVFSPFAKVKNIASSYPIILTCGSILLNYNEKEKSFSVAGYYFYVLEGEIYQPKQGKYTLVQLAESFMNVPYLWGGKNIFGIDCSGMVQVVMSLSGMQLPRDAKDQCKLGEEITFGEKRMNDLAFFCNENGRVSHVGIVLDDGNIIHASGKVRIDKLTETGIFSEEWGKQTHTLCMIKRLAL